MKPPKKHLLILLISLFYFSFVQNPNLFGQYRFDSWTTDDGLPQNGLREITQTPDGYLWFTTFDGLVRFDGVEFTTFNKGNTKGITNSRFMRITTDKDGSIYASTTDNGTITVYKNGEFSSYTSEQVPGHYIEVIKPDANGDLRFLAVDENQKIETWYYLRDGKFVLDEKVNKTDVKINYKGKSGKTWVVTKNKTIEFDNGKSTVYPFYIERFDSQIEVFEDSEGSLWVSDTKLTRFRNGIIEYPGKHLNFPRRGDFHSFWEEPDGSLWFANGGRTGAGLGLVRFKDGEFSIFGKEKGLSDTNIISVFRDREGIIWLTTNKGLNRLRREVLKTYSTKDGLGDHEIYPIYRDSKEQIWIGTARGLNIYRNGIFEKVNFEHKVKPYSKVAHWRNEVVSIQSLLEDSKGKMWIGVYGGIFIAENGKANMLRSSEGHHVQAILEDRNGNIWAASDKGVLLYKDYELKAVYKVKDGLPNRFITNIYEDSKGELWFGGYGGLSKLRDGKFTNYTSKQGLTGNYVRSIYEDAEGTFWIGTYDEGLSRFKDGKFFNYKKKDGLFSNGVFAIQEDEHGYFWISSNQGIYRVNKQALDDFANGNISKIHSIGYGKEDGMLNNECNGGRQPSSIKDETGKIWFPTQDGVVVVDPNLEIRNSKPPSAIIESATVDRQSIDIKKGLVIEPGKKNLAIKFTGVSLIKSRQINFKYKLEGHDLNWIDAGTQRTAYYSHLPPGKYTFRVKAANSDGIWDTKGAKLAVKLQPFFYQTTWFYLLCIIASVIILVLIWKISVYRLEVREKRLEELVNKKTEQLRIANEELQDQANSDGLTEIGNRRRFEEFLSDEWHRAIRFKTEISLVLIDIDHFKLFNDAYGHLEGDDCLKKVANALNDTINRPTDLVARFGGEEFAIVLGGTDAVGAMTIAKEAFESVVNLKISHADSETSKYLTVSAGVATTFAELGKSENDLIQAADLALYEAKEKGRNQITANDLTKTEYRVPASETQQIDLIG